MRIENDRNAFIMRFQLFRIIALWLFRKILRPPLLLLILTLECLELLAAVVLLPPIVVPPAVCLVEILSDL